MKAVVVNEGGGLSYEDFPDPVAGSGEVVVELKAAAINRRDLLLRNPPGPAYEFPKPIVPGSDGAGIRRDTGEEVVIYPGLHWGPREDAAGPELAESSAGRRTARTPSSSSCPRRTSTRSPRDCRGRRPRRSRSQP